MSSEDEDSDLIELALSNKNPKTSPQENQSFQLLNSSASHEKKRCQSTMDLFPERAPMNSILLGSGEIDESGMDEEEEDDEIGEQDVEKWRRSALGFFLLGFFNNFTWVLMNAGAGDIVPGKFALIYIVNQVPSLTVKATAPHWFHLVSYNTRIIMCCLCMACCFPFITYGTTVNMQLIGVAMVSIQTGIGECTVLGLSQHYPNPKECLSFWSSGTGFAGPGGYLISIFLLSILSPAGRVAVGEVSCLIFGLSYFYLLPRGIVVEGSDKDSRSSGVIVLPPHKERWSYQIRNMSKDIVFKPRNPKASSKSAHGTDSESQANDSMSLFAEDSVQKNVDRTFVGPSLHSRCSDPSLFKTPYEEAKEYAEMAAQAEIENLSLGDRPPNNTWERIIVVAELWRYLIPLFGIYWAEYVLQAGTWSCFSFQPHKIQSKHYRNIAYKYLNLFYQCGVFISRSSAALFTIRRVYYLWLMALFQCVLLALFTLQSAYQYLETGTYLLAPAFVVGLLGGGVYVNSLVSINRDVQPALREISLTSVSVSDSLGVLLADICSLWWQWCLFKANGISDQADGSCPF